MSIRIHLFYPRMQAFVGNRHTLDVEGLTVGDCLFDLKNQFPGVEQFLFDDQGKYLRHVFVYINAERAQKAGLNDPVKEGDMILIAVLVTGG